LKAAGKPVNTPGTPLGAAAATMAHGASGVWLRAVARLGLTCRGAVYLLVGYLALRLALATHGRTGAPASSAGAVREVVAPAWGRVPLVLLIAGLGAYALSQLLVPPGSWWRPAREKPRSRSSNRTRRPQRPCCAPASAACCWSWPESWSWRLAWRSVAGPFGFRERFTVQLVPAALARLTRSLGAVGCAARSVVFVLVGVFMGKAGVLASAKQTKGLDAIFRSVGGFASARGCRPCSRAACSATGSTVCSRFATVT
jgi:hypothetical protein